MRYSRSFLLLTFLIKYEKNLFKEILFVCSIIYAIVEFFLLLFKVRRTNNEKILTLIMNKEMFAMCFIENNNKLCNYHHRQTIKLAFVIFGAIYIL